MNAIPPATMRAASQTAAKATADRERAEATEATAVAKRAEAEAAAATARAEAEMAEAEAAAAGKCYKGLDTPILTAPPSHRRSVAIDAARVGPELWPQLCSC